MHILFATSVIAAKPILRFVEPVSLRPVTLVGTMHYNPRSISLVRSIIAEAAPLGSVCVELCDARWNATISAPRICENEYQVALEAAQSVGVDTLQLVDQPIGTTVSRAAELLRETASDAVSLAGWSLSLIHISEPTRPY